MTNVEIDLILQELRQYDEDGDESRSREDRIALLRRLNSAQATTRTLAMEILSLIFQFTCPHIQLDKEGRECNPRGWYSRRFFPLTLGHVSHHWRQVAWSTPELWSTLSLHIYMRTKLESTTGLLNLYLTNVSNFPISLDLDLPPTANAKKVCAAIDRILFRPESSQKIKFLQIANVPSGWAPSFDGFSRLAHLSMDGQNDLHEKLSNLALTDIHTLTRVSLRNVNPRVQLFWPSITIVELDSVAIDLCGELLAQCMNLVKFHTTTLHRPRHGWRQDGIISSSNDKLVYHQLEELRWSHITDAHLLTLFNRIELPALRHLSWSQTTGLAHTADGMFDSESFPHIKALFSRLPKSLISVKFHHLYVWPTSTLQYVLPRINGIQELTLRYCHKNTVCNFLKVLNMPSMYYLPSLKSLAINYCYGAWSETNQGMHHDLIIQFLGGRFERGMAPQFRLELLNVNSDWEIPLRGALKRLVKKGMSLELIINGKKIDWEQKDEMPRRHRMEKEIFYSWGWY